MKSWILWSGIGLVWFSVPLFVVWGWNAIRDTRRRRREGERYVSFRELMAPRRPSLFDRVFDWFNETAEKVVRS